MKTVKSVLPKMAGFFLVMLIITSVIYPAVITAAANVAFGHEANGSVIVGKDGTKYGSALLAQEFTGNQYLWGRVMMWIQGRLQTKTESLWHMQVPPTRHRQAVSLKP